MDKKDYVKRTIRISATASMLLDQLAEETEMTISQAAETAIKFYCGADDRSTEDEKRIRKMLSKITEQNYHLINILNSLAVNLNYDIFKPADTEPYKWLTTSRQMYSDSALKAQTEKLIKQQDK